MSVAQLCVFFPSLKPQDLSDRKAWAIEVGRRHCQRLRKRVGYRLVYTNQSEWVDGKVETGWGSSWRRATAGQR